MFTGLIEDIGTITERSTEDGVLCLSIAASHALQDVSLGASVAVNGTCLTVVDVTHDPAETDSDDTVTTARFHVMAETVERTTLKNARPGTRVNLERPLIYNTSRLDGHFTLGHVDGTTTLLHRHHDVNSDVFRFALPQHLACYVVEKGSIAINGTSLTVAALHREESGQESFEVALIPTTLTHTVLGSLQVGDEVNIEVDILGKYIARMLETGSIQEPSRGVITE